MKSAVREQGGISGVSPRELRAGLTLAILLMSLVLASQPAHSQTFSVLYSFTGKNGDGADPMAGLVRDAAGNFYGVTSGGGSGGAGTVFKLSMGQDGAWTETILHRFEGGSDGAFPLGRLVLDLEGNLYGTTSGVAGTVFKLTPSGEKTVLYTFCSVANCADGASPNGGLVRDGSGNLYGTTALGGNSAFCPEGCGGVFKVTKTGEEVVLYSFCSIANCADGSFPIGGDGFFNDETLVRDGLGNLYGTTPTGGDAAFCSDDRGCGTVFKVSKDGKETVLHSFCSSAKCADGSYPEVGLIQDAASNLYGTTSDGGAHIRYGTVYQVNAAGDETVLYSFHGRAAVGQVSPSSLALDAAGNLYGTTAHGGAFNSGSVFTVTTAGRARILYSFNNASDGGEPQGGLVLDSAGNLYGTASAGNLQDCNGNGCGIVFELAP